MVTKWAALSVSWPPPGDLELFVRGKYMRGYREGNTVYDASGNSICVLDKLQDYRGLWWRAEGVKG